MVPRWSHMIDLALFESTRWTRSGDSSIVYRCRGADATRTVRSNRSDDCMGDWWMAWLAGASLDTTGHLHPLFPKKVECIPSIWESRHPIRRGNSDRPSDLLDRPACRRLHARPKSLRIQPTTQGTPYPQSNITQGTYASKAARSTSVCLKKVHPRI